MHKMNKNLLRLLKEKEITLNNEGQEEEIYSNFKKNLKCIDDEIKTPNTTTKSKNKDILYSLMKILSISTILYLKNPTEFEETLFDLRALIKNLTGIDDEGEAAKKRKSSQISEIDSESLVKFQEIFTDICLQLSSLGNQTLYEFVFKSFKKVSKYLSSNSIQILVDFIKEQN